MLASAWVVKCEAHGSRDVERVRGDADSFGVAVGTREMLRERLESVLPTLSHRIL